MSALENKELLLRVVTQFAAFQLKKSGELMPFGATLNSSRKVELLMPESIKQNVTIDELSTYWIRELGEAQLRPLFSQRVFSFGFPRVAKVSQLATNGR